ncbi:hypothetical protein [Kiloniella sp.]|uniref:hypothetical protein n=1 Tax=Kiloniella sp. TaxID=1938587 RepID=UPI003B014C18
MTSPPASYDAEVQDKLSALIASGEINPEDNTLKELMRRNELGVPNLWLDIRSVTGFEKSFISINNFRKWFMPTHPLLKGRPDRADNFTQYLLGCFQGPCFILDKEKKLQPTPALTGIDFIEAASYLICDMGSSTAAKKLTQHGKSLITLENAKSCLEILRLRHAEVENYIKDILRDFILDLFQYAPLEQPDLNGEIEGEPGKGGSVFTKVLSNEQNEFLKEIFATGYHTLSNSDDDLFADGRPRSAKELKLTEDERTLFVETGYHIARVMWHCLGESDPTFKSEMWNNGQSIFEVGCDIMGELGVFDADKDPYYFFAMPLDNVREHLKSHIPISNYRLESIIGNFLSTTSHYREEISDEKATFEVQGGFQQAMWAFVQCGYATREANGFVWSDKIAPIMVAENLWDQEEESYTTENKKKTVDLTEQIWAAIPLWRRHLMARWIGHKSEMDVFLYLFRRWDGKRFHWFEKIQKNRTENLPTGYQQATREICQRLIEIRRSHPI